MTRNMGTLDRAVRAFLVAPVAIGLGFAFGATTVLGIVLFVLAAVMLATSATGYCPLYTVIGISTQQHVHRVDRGMRAGHA